MVTPEVRLNWLKELAVSGSWQEEPSCVEGLSPNGNPFRVIFTTGPSWSSCDWFRPGFEAELVSGVAVLGPREVRLEQEPLLLRVLVFFCFARVI